LLKGDIAMHIPPNISFEEAATMGGGLATVALAMYKHLQLPFLALPSLENAEDEEKKTPILIYGGSTATGTLAIQFAKLCVSPTPVALSEVDIGADETYRSGLEVITAASPHNFSLLKSLGADHVLDYVRPPSTLSSSPKLTLYSATPNAVTKSTP
jgi:NADPH:quinone reductase-like Zn-dependent oxidoreductase